MASDSDGWIIFRFCGFADGGVMGGVLSDFVALGSAGWSIIRFCGSGGWNVFSIYGFRDWWVNYFQILRLRGGAGR